MLRASSFRLLSKVSFPLHQKAPAIRSVKPLSNHRATTRSFSVGQGLRSDNNLSNHQARMGQRMVRVPPNSMSGALGKTRRFSADPGGPKQNKLA